MILDNVTLFPATDEGPIRDTSLRIVNGEIDAIGAKGDGGEEVRDLGGAWVTPGFIDAHVHLCFDGRLDPYELEAHRPSEAASIAMQNARRQLRAGFTTVRDCGAPGPIVIDVARVLDRGSGPAPRILASGNPLIVTGGHGTFAADRVCDGADEFLRAARENLRDGADFLKLIGTGGVLSEGSEPGNIAVSEAELEAVAGEAKRSGVDLAVHAHGDGGVRAALESGATTVEHCTYASTDTLDRFERSNTGYVSTIISTVVQTTDEAVADGIAPYVTEKATEALQAQLETFKEAQQRDIPILIGTDAGTPRNPHGSGAREFTQFVEHGFDPADALRAGTSLPAEVLDIDDQIGTIEVGSTADLVVLPGNPLEDISVTEQPEAVIREGTLVSGGKDEW